MSNYPTAPDNLPADHVDNVGEIILALHVNRLDEALNAVMSELGNLPSGTYSSVRARLDDIAVGQLPVGPSAGRVLLYQATGAVLGWRRPMSVFDVVEGFGATGDGTTNDTAAIQAAVNACQAAGGGQVFFPPGQFRVTSINVPYGVPIVFQGSGSSAHSSRTDINCTSIRRLSGAAPLINAVGIQMSGPSNLQKVLFQLFDMQLDGCIDGVNPAPGKLLYLDTAGNFQSRNVKFNECLDRAVHMVHVTNSGASEWYFWKCGNGAGAPALDLDSNAFAATHTVKFDQIEFERNRGTDMRVHGSNAAWSVNWVTLMNFKQERHNVGEIYPVFDIGFSQDTIISGGSIYLSQSDANARMLRTTVTTGGSGSSGVRFSDVVLTGATNYAGIYMIEHEFGVMHLDNLKFYVNPLTTKAIRVKINAGLDSFHPSNLQFSDNTKRIVDERAGAKTIRGGYMREIQETATSATGAVAAGGTLPLATVALAGARAGDAVRAQHTSYSMPMALIVQGRVTSDNTVTVWAYNPTGAASAVPSGLIRCTVWALN